MSGKARAIALILIAALVVAGLWLVPTPGPGEQVSAFAGEVVQNEPPVVDGPAPASDGESLVNQSTDPMDSSDYDAAAAALLSKRTDLSDPKNRAELVAQLERLDEEHDRMLLRKAGALGIKTRGIDDDGTEFVLRGFEGDLPVFEQTENIRAAISTAAHRVRSTAPFNVDGTGELIGLWEINQPRATHVEFGSPSRLTFGQLSSGTSGHASHVAGTLIGMGQNSSLKGMAPGAKILSYSSGNDSTEMTAAGAAVAGEPGKISVSNHSYGFRTGWSDNTWNGRFVNDSDPSNDFDSDFGRYSSLSSLMDGLTYNLPYYLPFFSAGNHANDNAPADGAPWAHGSNTYVYNSSIHPAGDGSYKNGYDTCEGKKVAKNVMTVGAVTDAASGSGRDVALASKAGFSSTGPTDDGRIKPDIVANGVSLTSSGGSSDTSSYSSSGTSMASPNAAGSAVLLCDYYGSRFPGGAMRAATLKGLIIHTADDMGSPGPDYLHGWGLMNTLAAAELIRDHADHGDRMIEERLDGANSMRQISVSATGARPLRVTLSWTDPAGSSRSGNDNRSKALVNDLNLTVQGPDGTHLPYVMPHVGDWSPATLDDLATTGVNVVDNVEQVYLPATVGGAYTITVDHNGPLTNGVQDYSLIVSGFGDLPEIEVKDSEGLGLVDGVATVMVDSVPVGDQGDPVVLKILNSGEGELRNLVVTKDGSDAGDFEVGPLGSTSLSAGEETEFTLVFSPGSSGMRTAAIHVASNDADEGSFDIQISGVGLHTLNSWRLEYFQTESNAGDAADLADPNKDGLVNLMAFALGLNPLETSTVPLEFAVGGDDLMVSYPRSRAAMAEGLAFGIEWSETLKSDWSTVGVTETNVLDDGFIQQVEVQVPKGFGRRFIRLQVSRP